MIAQSQALLDAVASRASPGIVQAVQQAEADLASDRFVLAILGKAKRGKSTLVNALLGRQDDAVAPIDKLPASSAISRIRWGERELATAVFEDGRRETIPFARIREYVTEESNPLNAKGIHLVDISGPFPRLDRDLELVDTPGAGSVHEHHDLLLHAFIPQADAVLFLVTARMPLDQDELELLQQVNAADLSKIFFVMNRVDEEPAQNVSDAIAHNQRVLAQAGISTESFWTISGKQSLQGDFEGSGVAALMRDIQQFLAAHKGEVLAGRFVARVQAAVFPVVEQWEAEAAVAQRSEAELEEELAALRRRKQELESERAFAEREFTHAWGVAVDQYEQGVIKAKPQVLAALHARFEQTSLFELSSFRKQLPDFLQRTFETQIGGAAVRFEQAARQACERLQTDSPQVLVGDAGELVVRTREGMATLAGAAGGVVLTAAGSGIAAMGAATAATIAAANAAALTATTTVAAPSALAGLMGMIGLEALVPLATGTATVAAPAALTTTPLWVALAGPVGWTLAGLGLCAVPLSWRLSKLKLKDQLSAACEEQVDQVFRRLREEDIPNLRRMGKAIAEEFRIRLDRQLSQMESTLTAARDRRLSPEDADQLRGRATQARQAWEALREGALTFSRSRPS